MFKRAREGSILSASTGFAFMMGSLGFYSFFVSLSIFYEPTFPFNETHFFGSIILLTGMMIFLVFMELDERKYYTDKKNFFILTFMGIIGLIIMLPMSYLTYHSQLASVLVLALPVTYGCYQYSHHFKSLEILRKSRRIKLSSSFLIGIYIAGYSIFTLFFNSFGEIIFFLNSILVMLGGIIATVSFNKLPPLTELKWLLELDRLIIIHLSTSNVMYKFEFVHKEKDNISEPIDIDIAGTAIGGVDMLLKEVLASDGNIKEIEHGNKKLMFNHGKKTGCILISQGGSKEIRDRLEVFHLNFEIQFNSIIENWNGSTSPFRNSKLLVKKFFL